MNDEVWLFVLDFAAPAPEPAGDEVWDWIEWLDDREES